MHPKLKRKNNKQGISLRKFLPFFSFVMALYLLNFSIDIPGNPLHLYSGITQECNEVENLVEFILDVDIDLQDANPEGGDFEQKGKRGISFNPFDLFLHQNHSSSITFTPHIKHIARPELTIPNSRLQEVNSPPPEEKWLSGTTL